MASCSRSTGSSQIHQDRVTNPTRLNPPESRGDQRNPIGTCIIRYTGKIDGVKGAEIVYFDKWGLREVVTRTVEGKDPVKTLMI